MQAQHQQHNSPAPQAHIESFLASLTEVVPPEFMASVREDLAPFITMVRTANVPFAQPDQSRLEALPGMLATLRARPYAHAVAVPFAQLVRGEAPMVQGSAMLPQWNRVIQQRATHFVTTLGSAVAMELFEEGLRNALEQTMQRATAKRIREYPPCAGAKYLHENMVDMLSAYLCAAGTGDRQLLRQLSAVLHMAKDGHVPFMEKKNGGGSLILLVATA